MAAADPPAGLVDIASALSQDEIPFKLRCAICNKLAFNAFRLPCCDQSICETCQASLPDTCPVCAHTPVSPDLCKANKALRTTLKAFLRTEEKKREKGRQSAAPPTPVITTPAENGTTSTETTADQKQAEATPAEAPVGSLPAETETDEATNEAPPVDAASGSIADNRVPELAEIKAEVRLSIIPSRYGSGSNLAQSETNGDQAPGTTTAPSTGADAQLITGEVLADDESALHDPSHQPGSNMINMGPGGFPGTGWNGNNNFNAMNPFMGNSMFNFPNAMGMPMTMDPMAANQGMFGDYGMNMTGMGMNMGMNFNGQGMYGSLGWDGSQQNLWQGGQDKFNPNAFANGMGPPYGGAFGGSKMSYPSNSDFQSGYYGPGYGRGGGFRGRGRGYFHGGPGRAGFGGPGLAHLSHGNAGLPTPLASSTAAARPDGTSAEDPSQMNENSGADPVSDPNTHDTDGNPEAPIEPTATDNPSQQLQGIPTIDSLDQAAVSTGPSSYQGHMGSGYGRGGYMRGPVPGGRGGGYWNGMPGAYRPQPEVRNPGVEGAPAAPRAMRQGLPNTSIFRQRGFHIQGRASASSNTPALSQRGNSEAPQDAPRTRSPSKAPSKAPSQAPRAGSRSRSPSQSRASRAHSPPGDDRESCREPDSKQNDTTGETQADRRSRSPSRMSSRRSSRRRDRDGERDRKSSHRSHRSRRHRSRSDSRDRSPARNGDGRFPDRHTLIAEENGPNGHSKAPLDAGERADLASRISSSHRSGRDRPSRREDDRERDRTRDSRRRDRDRERDKRDRDRDRDSDRRDREHDRDRERDHGRDREKERKRRRDRSESANAINRSSQPQTRRVKHSCDDRDRDLPRAPPAKSEPEKDPYTQEREARNRERLLREQQNRGSAKSGNTKSGHRRDSRQDRAVGGRRINYKYEDEL
ncbi:uncharacterized protein N7482_007919 [Penicillium canariense]|uniref:RING-type domain-containing protein n=1 Tax=Penicillium canariense TaxID=189055 RepID=A0A9W9I2M6_9EURO|nr:uncharacterized protein N7482_007919 [Penicillium canariense]KAJ5160915.1 hypothetical protein N7482_007919 [Penicillium canariense]